jgi:hypothetical protein
MARVTLIGELDTVVAVIPIRTVDAFMSNTINGIVATVAARGMGNSSAWLKQLVVNVGGIVPTSKSVTRVMAMLSLPNARQAKIVVLAIRTTN